MPRLPPFPPLPQQEQKEYQRGNQAGDQEEIEEIPRELGPVELDIPRRPDIWPKLQEEAAQWWTKQAFKGHRPFHKKGQDKGHQPA
jgi:hypothetical protein